MAAATYNASADRYDDPANSFWERFGSETVDRLGLRPGARVLDVCCGSGASAIAAAQAVGPDGSVLGVDLAERLLERARAKASDRGLRHAEFRLGDLRDLGLPEGHFDAVACVFGIFFVDDMPAALRALWHVTRPGGTLAITTWGPRFLEPGSTAFWDSIRDVRPDLHKGFNPWDTVSDPPSLNALLHAAGIEGAKVVAKAGTHAIPNPESWWSAVLGTGYRGTFEKLDADARERVRAANLDFIRTTGTRLRRDERRLRGRHQAMTDDPALRITREQAVAFRLARHHLSERLGRTGAESAAVVGLQDTPPGTAALALAARADVAPAALDKLVLVPSVRGAPLAVATEGLAIFTAGLEPPDEEAAKALVGSAWKSLNGVTAMDALDRVSEAVHDSLRAGPLPRDEFHQALRERLPKKLLWWCKGCNSHHVHPSLWRATGVRGVLAIVGREGRSAVFGAPAQASRRTRIPAASWRGASWGPTARRGRSSSPIGRAWRRRTPRHSGSVQAISSRSTWTGRRRGRSRRTERAGEGAEDRRRAAACRTSTR